LVNALQAVMFITLKTSSLEGLGLRYLVGFGERDGGFDPRAIPHEDLTKLWAKDH